MSFSNIIPVSDLGLPIGYKNTKDSIKFAMKEQEKRKERAQEGDWNRNLVKRKGRTGYEADKFENYFGPKALEQIGINQPPKKQ